MVLLLLPSAASRIILDRLQSLAETFEALLKRSSFLRSGSDNLIGGEILMGAQITINAVLLRLLNYLLLARATLVAR